MYTDIKGKCISVTLDNYDYDSDGVLWFDDTNDKEPFQPFTSEELSLPLDPPVTSLKIELPNFDDEGEYVGKVVTLRGKGELMTYEELFRALSDHFKDMDLGDHRYYEGLVLNTKTNIFEITTGS